MAGHEDPYHGPLKLSSPDLGNAFGEPKKSSLHVGGKRSDFPQRPFR
jgi:hypothetical protein